MWIIIVVSHSITLTPVASKLLEGVMLACCEEQLAVDDLQNGFRKKVGYADSIFTFRYVVDHFTSKSKYGLCCSVRHIQSISTLSVTRN